MNEFFGKVVWITGASSGIGEGLARAFAQAGAKVILSARRVEKLQELAHALSGATVLPLDLLDIPSLAQKVTDAYGVHGRIDIMVHNGGISQRTRAIETPLENTRRIMDTNFYGAVEITRHLLPLWRRDGGGRFLVISSLMGKHGGPGRSSYAASKHALHGYFESLRAEEWEHNIKVTLVTPGYIKTEFSVHALKSDGSEHGRMDQGQEKGMTPQDLAKRILAGVAKNKEELLIGGWECWGVMLKRFAPKVLSMILRGRNID